MYRDFKVSENTTNRQFLVITFFRNAKSKKKSKVLSLKQFNLSSCFKLLRHFLSRLKRSNRSCRLKIVSTLKTKHFIKEKKLLSSVFCSFWLKTYQVILLAVHSTKLYNFFVLLSRLLIKIITLFVFFS